MREHLVWLRVLCVNWCADLASRSATLDGSSLRTTGENGREWRDRRLVVVAPLPDQQFLPRLAQAAPDVFIAQ